MNFGEQYRPSVIYGYLDVGQVALFELLQHRQCPLLIELPECIDGPFVEVSVRHQACKKNPKTWSMAAGLWNNSQTLYPPTSLKNVVETFCHFLGQPSIDEGLVVLCVCCRNIHGLLFLLYWGRTPVHLSHSPVEYSQNHSDHFISADATSFVIQVSQ